MLPNWQIHNGFFTSFKKMKKLHIFLKKMKKIKKFFSFSKNMFCQLMYSPSRSVEFSFDNIMYQQIDDVAMGSSVPLFLLLPIFLWDFMNNYFLKTLLNLFFILNMLVTLLPFSVMKRNAINFFKNLIFCTHLWFLLTKKTLTSHCCFLMCWLKKSNKRFITSVYKKTHLQDSIHTGIHLDQRKEN